MSNKLLAGAGAIGSDTELWERLWKSVQAKAGGGFFFREVTSMLEGYIAFVSHENLHSFLCGYVLRDADDCRSQTVASDALRSGVTGVVMCYPMWVLGIKN